jgi:hypothetical protein
MQAANAGAAWATTTPAKTLPATAIDAIMRRTEDMSVFLRIN